MYTYFADNTAAVTTVYELKLRPGQKQMIRTTYVVDEYLDGDGERMLSIKWCPGHKDVEGNERADEKAKAGSELWAQDHSTMTNARRRTKEKALKTWQDEWKRTPATGGFTVANRMQPRWKPRENITHTPREVFERLTQCWTKHAFIGEYYAKFVPNKPTGCPCGQQFQTQEHVIRECLRYEESRDILRGVDEQMKMGILLGTKKGLDAMVKFLNKTDAFTKTREKR